MNLVERSPIKPGDDLDGLLRAFFRSQMPHPWPRPRMPRFRAASAPHPTSARRPLIRSRWALAASVALLVLGSLLLPGRFTRHIPPGDAPGGPGVGDTRLPWKQHPKNQAGQHKPAPAPEDEDPLRESDPFDQAPLK